MVEALLRRARSDSVRAVFVAGRLVYEEGRFLLVDREAASRNLAEHLSRSPSEQERRAHALSIALRPFISKVYDQSASSIDG